MLNNHLFASASFLENDAPKSESKVDVKLTQEPTVNHQPIITNNHGYSYDMPMVNGQVKHANAKSAGIVDWKGYSYDPPK